MASRIWNKIRCIAKGRVLDGLDRLESPEQTLRVRVDESEDAYQDAKVAAAGFAVTIKRLEKDREQCRRLRDEWAYRAEEAARAGDDPAARQSLIERARLEERLVRLEPRITEAQTTYKRLREDLTRLRERLDATRLRQAELRGRQHAADAQRRFARSLGQVGEGGGSNEAFYAMEESVLTTESEAEIERAVAEEGEDRIGESALALRADSELVALKQRLAKEQ